jgi:hypothetical protein
MPSTLRTRPLVATLALAAALLGAPDAPAQTAKKAAPRPPGPSIENVRVGFGELYPGRYKAGTWTPVFVDLMTDRPPFRGQVEVVAPDDDGVPTAARYPADLPDRERRTITAYTRPGTLAADVTVRLLDADGKPLPIRSATVAPEPLEPGSQVVLSAGETSGLNLVAQLPKYQTGLSRSPELIVSPLRDFPGHGYGFDGVEAIVLELGDAELVKQIQAGADRVLRDWVEQGGHLVVVIGSSADWQRGELDKRLGALLPALPAEEVQLIDQKEIESFAGGTAKPLKSIPRVVRLAGWAERGGVPIAASAVTPLVVRGSYGLGRVTITGIDVAHEPFASWESRMLFWDRLLGFRGRAGESAVFGATGRGAIIQSAAPELAARLYRSLESFPGVRIVPFGWVAFFVFAYIVLIGPVDYLFLRKVVKRMELTWITFPIIVVGVSLLAYFGAHAFKGSNLRVNKVDVLDFDQTSGVVRGHTWFTVFSPANHDYDLTFRPHGPDFDPDGTSADVESQTLSWFASPDPVLGGTGRISFGQAGYRYEPLGNPQTLAGVRVQIWSTKSFTGQWAGTFGRPVVEAQLQTVSGDRLAGSVRNVLDQTLTNARLFYGRNVYDLGTIRPGGVARVDPTQRTEAISAYLGRIGQSLQESLNRYYYPDPNQPDDPIRRVTDSRTEILRAAMFHGALGLRAEQFPSRALRHLDLSEQVGELHRPMLVAEVAAPAATLDLKNPPASPEIEQTSLLRVVLPLGAEPQTEAETP